MKYVAFAVVVIALAGVIAWQGFLHTPQPQSVTSFEECVAQGNAVMESYPRQCNDAAGNHFVETITEPLRPVVSYENSDGRMIAVATPLPGATVGKQFSIIGQARGMWFFEASFPVELVTNDGAVLARGIAEAKTDWMTEKFVPFTADLKIDNTQFAGAAILVLKRDNASGLPEHDASISFPVVVE